MCDPIKPYGEFSAGLSHQIYVLCSGVTCPFAFYDVTYLGVYEDIRRICTTDNSMLSVGIDIWPDVWLFAPYFVSRFSIIEDFYLYIDHMSFMNAMTDLKNEEDLFLPEALNKFYALYFVILYQCIHIYHEESLPPGDISLVDVFKGLDIPCLRRTALVEIRSNEIIRLIISGGLRFTEGYRHLLDEMECIRTKGYAEELSITDTDYNELKVWGREHLDMEPAEWLRPYRKVDSSTVNDPASYDFSAAARILFSDYTNDERIIENIREIAYDHDSYYRHLISAFPMFEEHNQALYRKALFNAARYADDRVILRIAKLLWEGYLSADEKEEALYPFQRYAHEVRLYEPLSSERVEGLYKYCRYEQREPGLNIVSREWYFRLIHRFAPEMMGLKDSEQEISEEDIRALLEYIGEKDSDSIERKIIREALKNISR